MLKNVSELSINPTVLIKLFDSSHKFIVFFLRNLSKEEKESYAKEEATSTFSPHQIQILENEFAKQRYVTEDKRADFALEVNLVESRRTKWKKETKYEASASSSRSHEEMEHVLFAMQSTNPFCQNICVESLVNPFRVLPQHCAVPVFSTTEFKDAFAL